MLLIDADTEKSALTKFFAFSDRAGLAELLEKKGRHLQDTALEWICLGFGFFRPDRKSLSRTVFWAERR